MALKLKGKLVESLNHAQIIEDLQTMRYDEVGKKHGCSKGTIHRIAQHYDALKYKKNSLKDMSEKSKRHGWACGRPMAKYKGAYPNGFLTRLDLLLEITEKDKVLHLFSGSIQGREGEDTMDIQDTHSPTFVADARERFPMEDNTYDVVISDPPYDMKTNEGVKIDYSDKLWKTEFIKPYAWVKEAVRVLKPGGYLAILHHLVYKTPDECRRAMTVSITCGPNTRVRVLSIFQKLEDGEVKQVIHSKRMREIVEAAEIGETN